MIQNPYVDPCAQKGCARSSSKAEKGAFQLANDYYGQHQGKLPRVSIAKRSNEGVKSVIVVSYSRPQETLLPLDLDSPEISV